MAQQKETLMDRMTCGRLTPNDKAALAIVDRFSWSSNVMWRDKTIGSQYPVADAISEALADRASVLAITSEIVHRALALVSLWDNQKIAGLPRAERNAAIDETKAKFIEAVHEYAKASRAPKAATVEDESPQQGKVHRAPQAQGRKNRKQ